MAKTVSSAQTKKDKKKEVWMAQ